MMDSSDKFLRKNVFQQISMAVLYVDLVGSTTISMKLPPDKLSILISSFSQEMSYVIEKFDGYVLKFVGDAKKLSILNCTRQLKTSITVINESCLVLEEWKRSF